MTHAPALELHQPIARPTPHASPLVKWTLIGVALAFLTVMMVVPLAAVLVQAFGKGVEVAWHAISDHDARSAIALTLLTIAIAVPLNATFGVAAAWAITKFDFRGKTLLITLIDLPFSVSPIVAGLIFVLLLGANGVLGKALGFDPHIIFAPPGIVIATIFVTVPFVARELIPLMQAQGRDDEEAAVSLGASGWQVFRRVTLPNIRWGLIYGLILCNARAMGEFGAVSVVSGRIRGATNTMPLHVEALYDSYKTNAAFAVAALLVAMALLTLVAKTFAERRMRREALEQD